MTRKEDASKRHCMVVLAHYPLAETRVHREAEALVARGYEVDVISLRGPREAPQEHFQGIQVYRLPVRLVKSGLVRQFLNYLRFFALSAFKLTQLHKHRPYDVVQVHNLPDFLVFCALIPKLGGVPIILDLHDLMPEFYAGRFGQDKGGLLARLIRWQERLACRFADHVITVSEHWRQALIQRGVPAHKCSVVMNVADERVFVPRHDPPRSADSDDEFRLFYHGTIVHRYGLDLAIRAIDQVRRDIPNVRLVILGKGEQVPALVQLARELELGNHVTIYDELRPAEELPEIIQAADVGVVPYRNDVFTDGLLPTKLMEYAAMGLPSIAARTTAIQTYFSGTMAEFFEPDSVEDLAHSIRKVYNSPERLTELTKGCKVFNQRYNWRQVSAEYVALVDRLSNR